ncbi:apolipoprotein N-acyltransferase [Nocardioides sp.]|uniref:apolipoprotein N-acyltransferase n=1 Tax=Nocardioides sp. TaxID=35761 RepID=UPI00261B978D|nr:apolipoprotein N-acyltransferase [Nocardioides sp.]
MPRRLPLAFGRTVAASIAGVIVSLGFAPVGWWWLVPVGVAILFVAVRGARAGLGAVCGAAYGFRFLACHADWMRAVSDAAWLALGAANAVYYALIGLVAGWAWRRRGSPLWLALGWTSVEGLRASWPFGGMPWGQLAFASIDTPMQRLLPYVGTVGTTALIALLAALLARLVVLREPYRVAVSLSPGTATGIVLIVVVTGAAWLVPWQAATVGHWDVVVVQPGLQATSIGQQHYALTQRLADATTALARAVAAGESTRPDLVVWPENSTAVDPLHDSEDHGVISQAVEAIGVPILVGAMIDDGPTRVLNQGIVWEPDGTTEQRYTKRHPVPWGEYLPLRSVLGWLHFGTVLPGRNMVAGPRPTPLRIAGVSVADAICFDIAHDDVVLDQVGDGAQVVTVQTSNAAFRGTAQLRQQFDITRVRALETGRTVLVSALNGISGVIRPDGSAAQEVDGDGPATLRVDVPLRSARTPAVLAGAWTWRAMALVTLAGLVASGARGRRRAGVARRSGSVA